MGLTITALVISLLAIGTSAYALYRNFWTNRRLNNLHNAQAKAMNAKADEKKAAKEFVKSTDKANKKVAKAKSKDTLN